MIKRLCSALTLIALLSSPHSARADTFLLREVPGYPHVQSSDHFAAMWTDTLGLPFGNANADSGLRELESQRSFFLTKTAFPDPYSQASVKYKTNLFLVKNNSASTNLDAGHPAMWLHPEALRQPWTLAILNANSMQFGTVGFKNTVFGGWFWPSHASWMAHQMYPGETGCSEMYTRTANWYYGSTRNRYCNWQFLEYLKETEGIGFLARLWYDGWPAPTSPQYADEDLIRAIMRLKGWDFAKMGDAWGNFAMRMARYDFANGAVYRAKWEHGRPDWQMRLTRTPLETLDSALRRYVVPDVFAPQRYGYNIVRLRREPGQTRVRVAFRGIKQESSANPGFKKSRPGEPDSISAPGSAWRFGLVAVDTARMAFRYSPLMSSGDASLELSAAESEVYLVVSATPTNRQLIQWDQPYYTLYRYPWMCEIRGAWPEGLQPDAPRGPAGVAGARHPNGGGFVAATATVATTAYVAPGAMVLDKAKVQGQARLEGHAIAGGTAEVRDQAVLSGYAGVWAGQVFGSARIDGTAQITNAGTKVSGNAHVGGRSLDLEGAELSGTVQILGDAEIHAATANHGVFYQYFGPNEVANAEIGADRAAPEPEVTRVGPFLWDDAATGLGPLAAHARKASPVRFLSVSGQGKIPVAGARDASGRRASVPASGRPGSRLPDGVYFIRP
jgi:hypothetical protein